MCVHAVRRGESTRAGAFASIRRNPQDRRVKPRAASGPIGRWVIAGALVAAGCGGSGASIGAGSSTTSGGEHIASGENGLETGDAGAQTSAIEDSGAQTLATDAGLTSASDAGNASVATTEFPIAPMHLAPTAGAQREDARVDVELRADGTLYSHGHLIGQISGRRVIAPSGRELLSVGADGVVSLDGTATRVRMRDNGDVQMPNGTLLTFSPDGTPLAISTNQQSQPGPARVSGYRPELHRTAALLAVLAATVAMPAQ